MRPAGAPLSRGVEAKIPIKLNLISQKEGAGKKQIKRGEAPRRARFDPPFCNASRAAAPRGGASNRSFSQSLIWLLSPRVSSSSRGPYRRSLSLPPASGPPGVGARERRGAAGEKDDVCCAGVGILSLAGAADQRGERSARACAPGGGPRGEPAADEIRRAPAADGPRWNTLEARFTGRGRRMERRRMRAGRDALLVRRLVVGGRLGGEGGWAMVGERFWIRLLGMGDSRRFC